MSAIDKYIPYALETEQKTGIPAPIILGQAMLESSANLDSTLATQGNNLFGIKGVGPAGSIWLPTKEERNGQTVWEMAQFKKYNSPTESMLDHTALLQKPRYAEKLTGAETLSDWARGIWSGGYATDSKYPEKLMNTITSNGLDKLGGGSYTTGVYAQNVSYDPVTGGTINTGVLQASSIQDIFKFVLLLLLFIVGIIFLIQAFPLDKAVNKATDTVLDTVGTVAKPVKAVNKVRKMVKAKK